MLLLRIVSEKSEQILKIKLLLCIGQIEASTSTPWQPPGYLTFLKIIVQILLYPGQNVAQMPHTRVHLGHFTGS